jgi:hypothetical protein
MEYKYSRIDTVPQGETIPAENPCGEDTFNTFLPCHPFLDLQQVVQALVLVFL